MKEKLFLRLCLILVVAITVYSCRTDQFPENETFNDSSKFQLTSKRISLNEAKHKAKLLPELQKAEKEVEKQKLNIQEKLVNIGNGITIDTDEVIYMENGPDFHTYTFSVIRDNASANAPIENILMTPQTDGSYRVFHIVLNLTEADKTKIANRQYVDYKNKEQVTELASINLSSLNQKQMCIPHYYSIPVPCTGPEHHMPGVAGCPLEGNDRAYWVSIVTYDCFGELPATIMPTPTPVNGGGGGGGECPDCPDNSTPEPCVQIATDPTQVGIIDPNGCIVGIPTDPIIRPTQTPCAKIKAITDNTTYKSNIIDLTGKTTNTTESGWRMNNPTSNGTVNDLLQTSGGSRFISLTAFPTTYAILHSHFEQLYPIFSPHDIAFFNKWANTVYGNNQVTNPNVPIPRLGEISLTVVTLYGNYVLMYDDTVSISQLPDYSQTDMNALYRKYEEDYLNKGYENGVPDMNILEKEFLKFIRDQMNFPGLKLYKSDSNGNTEIYLDGNNRKTKKCP